MNDALALNILKQLERCADSLEVIAAATQGPDIWEPKTECMARGCVNGWVWDEGDGQHTAPHSRKCQVCS